MDKLYHEIKKYNNGFEIYCRYKKEGDENYATIYFSEVEVAGDNICKFCGKMLKE